MSSGKPDTGTLAGPTLSSTLTERVRESIIARRFHARREAASQQHAFELRCQPQPVARSVVPP